MTPTVTRQRPWWVAAAAAVAALVPTAGSAVAAPPSVAATIVVAADGSGNYRTVQAAVDSVPSNNTAAVTISIKKGTYTGLVRVPANKPHITFAGATGTASDVVLSESRPASQYGTDGSATVLIAAPDTAVRDLTIRNAYDEAANGASQALALYANGDRQTYTNVRFLGNQDTLLTWTGSSGKVMRQYFYRCYVEGDVDFIYGSGTAVFDNSQIHSLSRGSTSNNGYITAASTYTNNPYGLLFVNSTFTSNAAAGTVYLGRPWHPSGDVNAVAQVLIRNSTLGAHIRTSQPWTDMSGFSWKDARFSEYQNTGPGATVNSNRPQLSSGQAASYLARDYLAGSDGWNPVR
ncbi:pectinesterase family protein [Goodfellowiella coeruleoviolacea]|nr:pectinesterase family protein [Goodfellowiella coeruleoviolacea]